MKNEINIFYGMSGSCKTFTITKKKDSKEDLHVLFSQIKSWKYYQNGVFKGKVEDNNLLFSILHLTRLREFVDANHYEGFNLAVERGVTDSLFYWISCKGGIISEEDDAMIKEAVRQEHHLLLPDFYLIKKTLLIQKDKDFIENEIFKEPTRREKFSGSLENYLESQDRYVEFTKRYNNIDEVIEITNAKDYINNFK